MVNTRDGTATVELIVACALAGVTALSVAAGTSLAARIASRAELHDAAVIAATHIADSLATTLRPTDGTTRRGRHSLAWSVAEHEDRLFTIALHVHWNVAGRSDSLRFDMITTPPPRWIR